MSASEAMQKQIEDFEIEKAQLQEDSRSQAMELESSLHILQQKHQEETKEHLSALNAVFTACDKTMNDLDMLGELL